MTDTDVDQNVDVDTTTKDQDAVTEEHELGLHHGEVLFKLAHTYPELVRTIVEAVQNAIDAEAKTVFVGIDEGRRRVVVLDDGDGITVAKFQHALRSVGKGVKAAGKMGKFGLGMISPLDICDEFTIYSHPLDAELVNSWKFNSENIRAQHERVGIPYQSLTTFPGVPRQFVRVHRLGALWRTMIRMENTIADEERGVVSLDELQWLVRTKLRQGMLQNSTTVHAFKVGSDGRTETRVINMLHFTGERLPVIEYHVPGSPCGKVTIELYRAPEIKPGKRRGEVLIRQAGDTSEVPWREFYGQALGSRNLSSVKEAFYALGSGFFEGVITAEGIQMTPERNKFIVDDALKGLYAALRQWYREHGSVYFEDERDARQEDRYRGLGEKSLARISEMLGSDAFAPVVRRLSNFLPDGPKPPSISKPKRREPEPSGGGSAPVRRKRRRVVTDTPVNENGKPKLSHVALRLGYDVLESNRLWEFDFTTGVLIFNIIHPLWVRVDETDGKHTDRHDRQIMHLQEWLAMKLLLLLSEYDTPGFDLDLVRRPIDKEVRYYIEMFILGGATTN